MPSSATLSRLPAQWSLFAGLSIGLAAQHDSIVVAMAPCELQRPIDSFYVKSSRNLVAKGTVQVDGESFDIYLPKEKAYSRVPRPEQKGVLIVRTSTYLSVDQNHDGKIGALESYFAESPLRLGNAMFEIVDLPANGGSITIRRTDRPLTGAVLGRKAAEFDWTAIDGSKLRRDDFKNRVLVIDCWAPS